MKTMRINLLSMLILGFIFFTSSCNSKKAEDNENATEVVEEEVTENNEADNTVPTDDFGDLSKEESNLILGAYMALKNALVDTDKDTAKEAAGNIITALTEVKLTDILTSIKEDADHIATSDAVEDQRKYFDSLSQNMYALAKTGNSDQTIYKQYCPMAFDNQGAFWLSTEEEVLNPYFGDKMLKCGKVEETITQ